MFSDSCRVGSTRSGLLTRPKNSIALLRPERAPEAGSWHLPDPGRSLAKMGKGEDNVQHPFEGRWRSSREEDNLRELAIGLLPTLACVLGSALRWASP